MADLNVCDMDALAGELIADEGFKRERYKCPAGHWTIGIGHNLEAGPLPADVWQLIRSDHPQIATGLLADGIQLADDIVYKLFASDVLNAVASLDAIWIGWRALTEHRKRALINLAFQMGQSRLLGFIKFWRAIKNHDYSVAADELKDSLWFVQTQASRTSRVIEKIRNG